MKNEFDASPQVEVAIADATHHAELVMGADRNVSYFPEFGGDEMRGIFCLLR